MKAIYLTDEEYEWLCKAESFCWFCYPPECNNQQVAVHLDRQKTKALRQAIKNADDEAYAEATRKRERARARKLANKALQLK